VLRPVVSSCSKSRSEPFGSFSKVLRAETISGPANAATVAGG